MPSLFSRRVSRECYKTPVALTLNRNKRPYKCFSSTSYQAKLVFFCISPSLVFDSTDLDKFETLSSVIIN